MEENGFSLKKLAEFLKVDCIGNEQKIITGVANLESATPDEATFLANFRYANLLKETRAGVICVDPTISLLPGKNYFISKDPSQTFQQIMEIFLSLRPSTGFFSIHPTAVVHEEATLGENISIGPYAVIDKNASIGPNTVIGPFVYIGAGVQIGAHCILHAHSVIREYCFLGNRVILQPGAVIGSCGFGYITSAQGNHLKLQQLGNVVLEDDVEIGANSTIDRARFKTTKIGKGTKIDNLVQIAHNVELGNNNIIAAQTGIAGSSKTGNNVMMGGQVGIVGHIEVTDYVMIATRGGVSKSIKKPGKYAGSPTITLSEHNRTQVYLRNIEAYANKIEELEKKLATLQERANTAS